MSITVGNKQSPDQARLDVLRAEGERRRGLLEMEVAGSLRRLGIAYPANGRLDIYQLDRVLAQAKMEPRDRIALKSKCASLNLID
jgi:hypothetical protein